MRTEIIWSGPRPAKPTQGDVLIAFDPAKGFYEHAGKVYLTARVLPDEFNVRACPDRLRVAAYVETIAGELTREQVLEMPPAGTGSEPVHGPGLVAVGVEGLEPDTEYSFVLFADFPY
jgi:hypothetical protein